VRGERLELRVLPRWTVKVLALSGEVDLSSATELQASIISLCEKDTRKLMVDLRDVTFLDAAGLRALLDGHAMCQERGAHLLCCVSEDSQVHRLLELTGIIDRPWVRLDPVQPRLSGALVGLFTI
jgi:anti-anti-sigma factor